MNLTLLYTRKFNTKIKLWTLFLRINVKRCFINRGINDEWNTDRNTKNKLFFLDGDNVEIQNMCRHISNRVRSLFVEKVFVYKNKKLIHRGPLLIINIDVFNTNFKFFCVCHSLINIIRVRRPFQGPQPAAKRSRWMISLNVHACYDSNHPYTVCFLTLIKYLRIKRRCSWHLLLFPEKCISRKSEYCK